MDFPDESRICSNCGSPMSNEYCSSCGQKYFDLGKLTVSHFAHELFHLFTHFDSKIFSAIRDLFRRPGYLTREFIEGKLKSHINPITLFFLLNAFFFFLGHQVLSINDADYAYYVSRNPDFAALTQSYAINHNLSDIEISHKFNGLMEVYRKAIYFVIVPLFAICLYLIFIRKKKLFVEFLVQATHTFSWYVLAMMVVIPLVLVISEVLEIRGRLFEWALTGILFIIAFWYNYTSTRRIFFDNKLHSFLYALPTTTVMVLLDGEISGWIVFQLAGLHFRF